MEEGDFPPTCCRLRARCKFARAQKTRRWCRVGVAALILLMNAALTASEGGRRHHHDGARRQRTLLDELDVLRGTVRKQHDADHRDKQSAEFFTENAAHGFDTHDVIVPIRLHHVSGEPVAHGRHFRRRKPSETPASRNHHRHRRSADDDDVIEDVIDIDDDEYTSEFERQRPDDDFWSEPFANYSLEAFGERFRLHLSPDVTFIAPNYTLQYMGDPKVDGYGGTDLGVPRHCFYSGYVNGRPDHTAVFSVCTGLFGAFRTSTSDYLIQPEYVDLSEHEPGSSAGGSHHHRDEEATKPHRIFRRSSGASPAADRVRSLCAYTEGEDDDADRQPAATTTTTTQTSDNATRDDDAKSRRKRYLSYARNVEVMVTADNEMLRNHDDVEHYVLTLMAIVNHVYHDPSIENLINIVLVKLIVIGNSQVGNGPMVDRDAHRCLKNFCEWQYQQNDPDDSHPNHFDASVLVTGLNICRSTSVCDTLGLAELGTMCNMKKSCSVNEDNGLSTAFTIAHEIGHEFDAPHDNSEKCLNDPGLGSGFNVMSPRLDHKAHPWTWSKCSAKFITSFLDNGKGDCLLDEPPQRIPQLPTEEPGQVFDADQQCSLVYGEGVNHCHFLFQSTCARLWCVSNNNSGCRTPHVPWADGTRCGDRKKKMWCQRGECVPEDRQRLPVPGSWGEWSRFGDCSRTCGGGIKIAVRLCDKPKPQYGGLYCTGRRKKFRPCNTQECPSLHSDFRAEQCADFNDWSRHHRHRIHGVALNAQWIPKYDGIQPSERCKLICQVRRSWDQFAAPWYVLRTKVINGTPCGRDTYDICVEGTCKKAGCDHVLNSVAVEDGCGVCAGDGSSCTTVRASFNSGFTFGYNRVAVIPAGATNIVVTQRSHTDGADDYNYLALRNARGSYILNGNRSVMKYKHTIEVRSNAVRNGGFTYLCDYSGTDSAVERINCTKPIGDKIVVEVLSAGDLMPPDITYQYNVRTSGQHAMTYRWDPNGPWSQCSRVCEGKARSKVLCVRSDAQVVADRFCSNLHKPTAITRPCNTRCTITWESRASECSARCGTGIISHRFQCCKITTIPPHDGAAARRLVEVVSSEMCEQPMPVRDEMCVGECLPTKWSYGPWGECSSTCAGQQRRTARCRDQAGRIVGDRDCAGNSPVTSRACDGDASSCPRWDFTVIERCGCGEGGKLRERRRVWCSVAGNPRPDAECDARSRPEAEVTCGARRACTSAWVYGEWGECSVTCGRGVETRARRCVDRNTALPVADNRTCDVIGEAGSRTCVRRPCSRYDDATTWRKGSPFVVTRRLHHDQLDPGLQSRKSSTAATTKATTIVGEHHFNHNNQAPPGGVLVVNRHRHPVALWRTGSWTECSASCGAGVRQRYVSCRHRDHEVADEECAGAKPPVREACATKCDGDWSTGSWSQCSATCGVGRRVRDVTCDDVIARCPDATKPDEVEACVVMTSCATVPQPTAATSHPNPMNKPRSNYTPTRAGDSAVRPGQWTTGPWSQCPVTCGGAVQTRTVVCLSRQRDETAARCDAAKRPADANVCNAQDCPRWHPGRWSKCTQQCGGGTRARIVYCARPDGARTYNHECDVTRRPSDVERCGDRPCSADHRWRKTEWSQCSSTCGRGVKTRNVTCVDQRSGLGVSDDACATARRPKPKQVRRCMVQRRCPRWRTGSWNQCSATCGEGKQVRRVSCRYKRKVIIDQLCDAARRPDDVQRCRTHHCPTYHWSPGEWGTCSTSCGEGVMTRRLTCRRKPDDAVADHPSRCNSTDDDVTMPMTSQRCSNGPCTAQWKVGSWTECSATCGPGRQRRAIRCTFVDLVTFDEREVTSCDGSRAPSRDRDCDRGDCDSQVLWRVGSWTECSTSCGDGIQQRRVVCVDRQTLDPLGDAVCNAIPSFRPDAIRRCHRAPCLPTTCRYLKIHYGVSRDDEYQLTLRGKSAKVYCRGMSTSRPLEYVTLPGGEQENYSEIYGYRLISADTCPYNGTRADTCACHRDHPDAGLTRYRKVRLDVAAMRVVGTDMTFATTVHGRPVPFGVAGDCYSRVQCPQGKFRMDFSRTSFVVSPTARWRSYGSESSMRIRRNPDGAAVDGYCGGYCSRCQPDPLTGLILDHKT